MIEKALAIEAISQEKARIQHLRQSEKSHKLQLKYGKRWLNIFLKRKKDRKRNNQNNNKFNLDNQVKPLSFPKRSPIKTPPRTKIFEESGFVDAIKKGEAEPSYRVSEKRIIDWFQKDFKKRETLAPRTRNIEKTPEKRNGTKKEFNSEMMFLEDLSLMNSPQQNGSKTISLEKRIALEEITREFEKKLENYKQLLEKEKNQQASKTDTIGLKIELKRMLIEIKRLKEN